MQTSGHTQNIKLSQRPTLRACAVLVAAVKESLRPLLSRGQKDTIDSQNASPPARHDRTGAKVELGVLHVKIAPRVAAARPVVTVATSRVARRAPKQEGASIGRNGAQDEALAPIELHLAQAQKAAANGDMQEAGRLLGLIEAWKWCRPSLPKLYIELEQKVAIALVDRHEEQAVQETKKEEWQQATRFWLKVCLARPTHARCHRKAAHALLMTGDLHKARDLALRAVDLDPKDVAARRILGHIYKQAGLQISARRQLEAAAVLDRTDGKGPASSMSTASFAALQQLTPAT